MYFVASQNILLITSTCLKFSFNSSSFIIVRLMCFVLLLYRIGTFSVFYVPSGMNTCWKLVISTKYLFLKYMSLSLFKLLYVFLLEIFFFFSRGGLFWTITSPYQWKYRGNVLRFALSLYSILGASLT